MLKLIHKKRKQTERKLYQQQPFTGGKKEAYRPDAGLIHDRKG